MPRTLADYEMAEQIGSGTVGSIFRAYDKQRQRDVALKLLHPGVSNDELVRLRFEREILVLQKLKHPNIVEYFDDGEDNGQLFYTMELVDGRTLKDVLQDRGHLQWQEAVECGWQVSSAVQHAHNFGVFHRDLKPANLYLSTTGMLKLGDFGIARDTAEAQITDQGMTVGSYLYMSPEQIRGEQQVSAQTDLYALGCLLFEMLTGHPPFTGSSFPQIFDQHLHAPIPSVRRAIPTCPERIDLLVQDLLQKDPSHRPLNARAVQGTLSDTMFDETGINLRQMLQSKLGTDAVRELATSSFQANRDVSWGRLLSIAGITIAIVVLAAILNSN